MDQGRLDPEGFRFAGSILPLNRPQTFARADPVRECSGSREVELRIPDILVVGHGLQGRAGASRFQPVRIEGYREKSFPWSRRPDDRSADTGETSCMLDRSFLPVILQRHGRDSGFMEVAVRNACGEQHGRPSRQDLRPPMGTLFRTMARRFLAPKFRS
jgi:hypothetical protein